MDWFDVSTNTFLPAENNYNKLGLVIFNLTFDITNKEGIKAVGANKSSNEFFTDLIYGTLSVPQNYMDLKIIID